MIKPEHLNDNTPSNKKVIEELLPHPDAPEGYVTGDEFVKRGKERISKYYKDNGLL